MYAGGIALVATVGMTGPAMAQDPSQTPSENFKFNHDSAYGQNGLSQRYAGPSSTGQSYGTGVAINASDSSQKVYTLVEANPNIDVRGPRGAFPASQPHDTVQLHPGRYLGPYYIVRRTSDGVIDARFGASGYVSAFTTSTDANYKFTSLCLDPGTGNVVIVGQETTSSGPVGVANAQSQTILNLRYLTSLVSIVSADSKPS